MIKQALTLVYDPVCPFAQRAWIALLEKQLPFDKMKINLKSKTAEFAEIYSKAYGRDPEAPAGKVPILIHGEKTITESDLICWYLQEEFSTGTSLVPADSFSRLKMRWFIQNVASKFVSAFYSTKLYQTKSPQDQQNVRAKIISTLELMNANIEGPYVLGANLSLADLFVYPWLERWCVQENIFGIQIPAKFTKIFALKQVFEQRASVLETKKETSPQFFTNLYRPYLRGEL